jgi:hypothetical protein
MPVMELEDSVCANDGCGQRFSLGWDGVCDGCTARAADHENGLHTIPMVECRDCW